MRTLAFIAILAASCFAQDREAPPPLGTPKAFALPAGDTYTLKNGMKVTLAQYGSVPLVTIRADMAFGKANESAGQVWLSNLTWQESADVTTKVTGDSIHEILYEIDRLRKDPPDTKELKGVQNYMGGIFVLQNTSNQGIIGQLSFVDLHGLKDDYLKTYVQKVNAVTRQDVQRITETYLNPAKMTYVVVGDKAKIEETLKSYPPK
jgi:zinc protease